MQPQALQVVGVKSPSWEGRASDLCPWQQPLPAALGAVVIDYEESVMLGTNGIGELIWGESSFPCFISVSDLSISQHAS